MKKLLSIGLSLVVGLGCVAGLAACGGNSEENQAIVDMIMTSLDIKYDSSTTKTENADYNIAGKVMVNQKLYSVSWKVSSEYSKVSSYISIGKKMDENYEYTVSVTKPEETFEYTLTATAKVGGAKKSIDFKRKVEAGAVDGDGTSVESPFSVAQALAIGKTLTSGNYYDGKTEGGVDADSAVRVYIRGYVIDPGHLYDGTNYKYSGGVSYPYIVDTYSEDKTTRDPDAFKIGSLTWNANLSETNLLENGEQIIVSGLLEIYNGTVTLYAPKLSNGNYENCYCEWRSGGNGNSQTPPPSGDAEHAGTAADPYTVADIRAVFNSLIANGNDLDKEIYVKGYITDIGKTYGTNLSSVVIGDTATSTNTFMFYDLAWNETLMGTFTGTTPFTVGDYLLVKGSALKMYGTTYEMVKTTAGVLPTIIEWTSPLTDEQRLTKALDALTIPGTLTANYTLPASTVAGVTFAVTASSNTNVISFNGTTLTVTRPTDADATVTVTVTATCNGKTDTKQFTIKVTKPTESTTEVNLDFVSGFATYAKEWTTSYSAHTVTFAEAGVSEVSGSVEMTNANKQQSGNEIDDRPVICAKNAVQYVTVNVVAGGTITGVEFDLKQWSSKTFADIHIEYQLGGTWTTCSSVITTPAKLAATGIPAGVTSVRLYYIASGSNNTQIGLTAIKLTVAD